MKLSRLSLAVLAASSLLSLAPSVRAEDPAAPTPPPARRAGGGRMSAEAQLKDLTEKLTLTAEQQPKVKAVLEEQIKARQAARDLTTAEERPAKMKAMREENTKKMKEILTADQFTKYEEIQKTQRGPRSPGAAAPAEGAAKKKKAE